MWSVLASFTVLVEKSCRLLVSDGDGEMSEGNYPILTAVNPHTTRQIFSQKHFEERNSIFIMISHFLVDLSIQGPIKSIVKSFFFSFFLREMFTSINPIKYIVYQKCNIFPTSYVALFPYFCFYS